MNKRRVSAKLWNEKRTYTVSLDLTVRGLRGQASVVEDVAVVEVALSPGVLVADDNYTLQYSFNGKQERQQLRVVYGMLCV
jgi:hypothetical protein